MKIIKVNKEQIDAILPDGIKSSDLISENAKTLLAGLLTYFNAYNLVAKSKGCLACPNVVLSKSTGITGVNLKSARDELIAMDLISVYVDEQYGVNTYTMHWQNLVKPLKRKTFEEMFKEFIGKEVNHD